MLPDAFHLLHQGLPRQAPGSDASTRRAIELLPALPRNPRVLDLACGPGAHTLVLAKTLHTRVTAIDIHEPFLDQLNKSAAERGLASLIETRNISMDALDSLLSPNSVDLIWCEGGIYLLGVSAALRDWRRFLRQDGVVSFTECTWLTDDPPAEATEFWETAYPAMTTVAGNVASARKEGYEIVASFALPPEDWWAEYYSPLRNRIGNVRGRATTDLELQSVLDNTEREIDLYERHSQGYGYVFYLAQIKQGG